MATIDGVYSCGHAGKVFYSGSAKANQWKADLEFSHLCPECQAKEDAERYEKIRTAHETGADSLQMLTGTVKQIIIAEEIRKNHLERITSEYDRMVKSDSGKELTEEEQKETKVIECAIRRMKEITSAVWWLDNRDSPISAFHNYVKEHRREIEAEIMGLSPSTMNRKKPNPKHEASPEEVKTPCIATIKIEPDAVLLESPRDEIIRSVAKEYKMRWNSFSWEYNLSSTSGSGQERAAELGHRLLQAGVTIRMPDAQTLQMAIDGSYQPRVDRWVMRYDSQSVIIKFPRGDDELYKTSKRLPGAKWESGRGMVVPATSVDEIYDFVKAMGFSVTDKAKTILDDALESKHNRVTVKPAAMEKPMSKEEELQAILHSSTDVLPDLIDTNEEEKK